MIPFSDAKAAASAVLALLKVKSEGLTDDGVGVIIYGNARVLLAHDATTGQLSCSAPVYTFRAAPRESMLQRLQQRAAGFGWSHPDVLLQWLPAHRQLAVCRVYSRLPETAAWWLELKALMLDAARFSDEGIAGL